MRESSGFRVGVNGNFSPGQNFSVNPSCIESPPPAKERMSAASNAAFFHSCSSSSLGTSFEPLGIDGELPSINVELPNIDV